MGVEESGPEGVEFLFQRRREGCPEVADESVARGRRGVEREVELGFTVSIYAVLQTEGSYHRLCGSFLGKDY